MKGTIIGWFGKGNLGDDLLEKVARDFIIDNSQVDSLTSISIDELYKNKSQSENIILDSDIVFVGPGGLINSGVNYIVEPLRKAKKLVLIGVSIEDYSGSSDRVLGFLAEKASISLFRDNDSKNYFYNFSPKGLVYLVNDFYLSANAEFFPEKINYKNNSLTVSLPRSWDRKVFQNRLIRYLKAKGAFHKSIHLSLQCPEIIEMCKTSSEICVIDSGDQEIFYNLSEVLNKKFYGVISNEEDLERFLYEKNLISARYHGTLIALKNGIYTESFCYQNKLFTLCNDYGLPIFNTNKMKSICLLKLIDDGVKSRTTIKSILESL
ncbi:polysaccharide pyruvyl transferase family protein [Vibrio mimicus]|uniref:polysaccharide pyruvyl transferase family protein n=1 Tax=Vibrio mimicus TaxID=674 RepID=UPI0011D4DCF0|nr:polysaccharide pyruvyl transferase family protein [Vibrio mimicus]TXY45630.1 polysaccharide pyruvyl transferase family protein [Vibrio mimicus]BCN22252.1 hypothetical protein [Vibrio mimicus]BCN22561.1 hypothetical protein [Vibrio mimicus]